MHVDKRFAVEKIADQRGNTILSVYRFTAPDGISESNGKGAHLLVMKAKSDEYKPGSDNVELMICNYIPDTGEAQEEGWY